MIGAREIGAMKPGAILINAARGEILDLDAALAALASGHLGGLAVDTFDVEPASCDAGVRANGRILDVARLGIDESGSIRYKLVKFAQIFRCQGELIFKTYRFHNVTLVINPAPFPAAVLMALRR